MKLLRIRFTQDAVETLHIFRADQWEVGEGVLFTWEWNADKSEHMNKRGFSLRNIVWWEWAE